MGKGIIFMGTSANAGKTNFVRALCRWMSNQGHNVQPFKAISTGSQFESRKGLTLDYRMWFFAEAARCPLANINAPIQVKIKEESSYLTEYILIKQDKVEVPIKIFAKDSPIFNMKLYKEIKEIVSESLDTLITSSSYIVIEGSGSPVDLRESDIANIFVARKTNFPIILISSISKGGGIASLIGTIDLFPSNLRKNIIGFAFNDIINGNETVHEQGILIEKRYGIPYLGAFPHLDIYDNVPPGKSSNLLTKEDEYNYLSEVLDQSINLDIIRKYLVPVNI